MLAEADRLTKWFQAWNYGYFRDKDYSHGVQAGDDCRQTLYSELGDLNRSIRTLNARLGPADR